MADFCTDCPLSETATQRVCGVGPKRRPEIPIMFVGEAPGKEEDKEGRPFVGVAGKDVFNPMLHFFKLTRKKCWIFNVLLCRPPDNKIASKEGKAAVKICPGRHLFPAIAKHKPVVIVAMGATAIKVLLNEMGVIKDKRGIPQQVTIEGHECVVIPTYHPAALIPSRNPQNKYLLYADVDRAINIATRGYKPIKERYWCLDTLKAIKAFMAFIRRKNIKLTSYDIESQLNDPDVGVDVHRDKVLGISFSWADGKAAYIPIRIRPVFSYSLEPFWGDNQDFVIDQLKILLENNVFKVDKGGQNKKYDNKVLYNDLGVIVRNVKFDTMLASHALDENQMSHALDEQVRIFIPEKRGWKSAVDVKDMAATPLSTIAHYCNTDADVERRLCGIHNRRLRRYPKLRKTFFNYVMPLQDTIQRMEQLGAPVDMRAVKKLSEDLDKERRKLELKMRKSFGRTVKVDSADEVLTALYDEGVDLSLLEEKDFNGNNVLDNKGRKKYKTDRNHLEVLGVESKLAQIVLDKRAVDKLKSTYVDPIMRKAIDGWIHTSFLLHGTVTGRLCIDGNTLLETSEGTFSVFDLDLTKHTKSTILTHTGQQRRIVNKFYKGRELMYEVKTNTGGKIVCTAGHRFLTNDGWYALKELSVGSKICTYDNKVEKSCSERSMDYFRRTKFCKTVFRRKSDKRGDAKRVWFITQYINLFSDVLYEKIWRRVARSTKEKLCTSYVRHTLWGTRQAWGYNFQKQVNTVGRRWLDCFSNITEAECKRTLCSEEYRVSRHKTKGRTSRQIFGFRCGAFEKIGWFVSRLLRENTSILRRSYRLLEGIISSILPFDAIGLVYETPGKEIFKIKRDRRSPTELYMLVSKSRRNGGIYGFIGQQYRSLSSIFFSWKSSSRLCISGDKFIGGNRRIGASINFGYQTRPSKRSKGFEIGIPDVKNFKKTSGKGFARGYQHHKESIITGIRSVGVRDVWDIEVEGDHSYVAAGFINHNSSRDPNLLNIVRGSEDDTKYQHVWGKRVKGIYRAPKGSYVLQADQSQMEVRSFAYYAGDEELAKACTLADVHLASACMLYELDYDESVAKYKAGDKWLKDLRQAAKSVTFLVFFGGSAEAAAKLLHISVEIVEAFIDAYFDRFAGADKWIKLIHKLIDRDKIVVDAFGWMRRIPYAGQKGRVGEAHRQAVNSIIQGFSARVCLMQLIDVERRFKKEGLKARPSLAVYDSIIPMNVPKAELEDTIYIMNDVMTKKPLPDFNIPLKVDFGYGEIWSELEDFELAA